MKFRFAALATAALFTSTASFAGVITSSSNIDFLAIDGQKASKSLLKETRSFNINDNQTHQVVVRVSEIVRSGSDRTLFESEPIVITFQGIADDILISAPRLETERDANKFKKDPVIHVKTVSGAEVSTKQEYLKQEGFLPSVNLIENLSEYNASGAPAAVAGFASTTMPAAIPGFAKAQKGKITVQGENVAEQMLQYWYQQADKETQQRFIQWAKNQK
ncbi:curli polymerization inhibitor CsgI-related protein [Pasteurella sp. PK-2025]|uniref:curli polymerization inhibitor CsgI-related protein n=1 Tax=unclassified Pasteurella TaxID=2621516 RepID=UPI003C71453E